jgi:hypothetical protein
MLSTHGHTERARLAVAIGVCAALAVLGISSLRAEHAPQQSMGLPDIGTDQPIGGQVVTLDQAAGVVPFSIYRPQDPVASDSTISRVMVWTPGPDSQATVRMEYGSGVVVTLTQWPAGQDPEVSYETQWKQAGGLGTLTTVNGHPAWLLPGNATATAPVTGSADVTISSGVADPTINTVELTIGSVDILIKGRLSIDELVRTAGTLG